MKKEVNKTEIEEAKKRLIKQIGEQNLETITNKEIKKIILKDRLKESIKKAKKGDIVYKFNEYSFEAETNKEYKIFEIGNKKSLLGKDDLIINKGGGYIAGGMNGKAVLKEEYNQYKEAIKEVEV